MQPSQVAYYALRRGLPARTVSLDPAPTSRKGLLATEPLATHGIYQASGSFRFLNVERNLGEVNGRFDWAPADMSRLWRYNLHYFDCLRQADMPAETKLALVEGWVRDNPPGSEPAWEPYTTSLRIVNWIVWIDQMQGDAPSRAIVDSLYQQLRWLARNDERHILANHYFENLKALLFGAAYFEGRFADELRQRASSRLLEQLREQFLPDGGHYERSPQYHCRMLENVLDLLSLVRAQGALFAPVLESELEAVASRALEWLAAVTFPDARIALFNDSAFDAAPSPAALRAYAGQLGLSVSVPCQGQAATLINLHSTGLYGLRAGPDMFLIDCGDIGPTYQPGHSHCDFLSFELMLGGRRVIVDSGVCEYEPGDLREYVRSTRAHNTVTVDDAEQSEVWSAFRVARRARREMAGAGRSSRAFRFEGAFRGFPTVPGGALHRREATLELDLGGNRIQRIELRDTIEGEGERTVRSYLHLHPSLSAHEVDHGNLELRDGERSIATLQWSTGGVAMTQETHSYCPEFGCAIPNTALVFTVRQKLPATLTCSLTVAEAA